MNKKNFLIFAGAILAFCGGVVLTKYFPVISPLVIFLEIAVGVLLGFILGKNKYKELAYNYETQYIDFQAEFILLQNKFNALKAKFDTIKVELEDTKKLVVPSVSENCRTEETPATLRSTLMETKGTSKNSSKKNKK